jgi:hypothetical protein
MSGAITFTRRCIYSRWFYALLLSVCLINVGAEILDILDPGKNLAIDLISLVASGLAALVSAAILIDLHLRHAKP